MRSIAWVVFPILVLEAHGAYGALISMTGTCLIYIDGSSRNKEQWDRQGSNMTTAEQQLDYRQETNCGVG